MSHRSGSSPVAVPTHVRSECVREMDRRVAVAISRDRVTRGAALAAYGAVMEQHAEDPCSAQRSLDAALDQLVGV
jgi:hypothetical protein